MAKAAEKLIILGDVCKGLLARLYNLTGSRFQKPNTLNADVERVCKMLKEKFPDHPNELEKQKGADLFQKRSQEICSELEDYYLTFLDVISFNDAALKLLQDMAKSIVSFNINTNLDLMCQFMDLLVSWLQLHLLLAEVADRRMYLSVYARAYTYTHGNTEPNFTRLAQFIEDYANPLARLRDQTTELSLSVGDTLMGLTMVVMSWNESKDYIDKKVFAFLDDVKDMQSITKIKEHNELLHRDKFITWVLYGFLLCPDQLQKDNALPMLTAALKTCFAVPIYRDVMYPIHQEFEKLFEKFAVNKFKLSKHRKHLKDCYDGDAPVITVKQHSGMRTYMRVTLKSALHFFKEFPGLLGPKLQMVFAMLRVARNEVFWYFSHLNVPPFRAKKYVKPEEFLDPRISELIYLIDEVAELITKYKTSIQEYYVAYLRQVDAISAHQKCGEFMQTTKLSHGIQELMSDIISTVGHATMEDDFEATRLNWYRLSAALTAQQSGVPAKNAEAINHAMTMIVVHSRNVDRIDSQLRANASLMMLFWYRQYIGEVLKVDLTSPNGQARCCLSLVKLLHAGLLNVHRFCPEEQKLIGGRAVACAEEYMSTIFSSVEKLLGSIFRMTSQHHQQIAPVQVVERYEATMKDTGTGGKPQPPGTESLYMRRPTMANLRIWRKNLGEICEAIRETERIVMYNMEIVPREYLYEATSKILRMFIRRITLANNSIQRPSLLLSQLKDVLHVAQSIDKHVAINLSEIAREVLITEFSDLASTGGAGVQRQAVVVPDEKKAEKTKVTIHALTDWYIRMLTRDLKADGVTFSDIKNGFVPFAAEGFLVDQYADLSELEALCTIIGPGGVRVFDQEILKQLSSGVAEVKDILLNNQAVLKSMVGRFTERLHWFECVKKLRLLDKLFNVCVSIGIFIKFRGLLQTALRNVTEKAVPFLFQNVHLLHNHHDTNYLADPGLVPLDMFAQDFGLDVTGADHTLKFVLEQYKDSTLDEAIWGLLPELYGACFVAPVWKECQYLIETESCNNNAHAMAETINLLIVTFNSMSLTEQNSEATDQKIIKDLKRCVHNAAFSLLHMNSKQPEFGVTFQEYPWSSLVTCIEGFIKVTKRLDLSMLEEFFPFTMLRTNYIQMYERQDVKGVSYAVVLDDEKE